MSPGAVALQTVGGIRMLDLIILVAYANVVLGLLISAAGLWGYRRNRSRPMLFLALGIATMTFVSSLAAVLTSRLLSPRFPGIVDQSFELLGLLFIAYSIYLLKRG